jgi:hypothetical protein
MYKQYQKLRAKSCFIGSPFTIKVCACMYVFICFLKQINRPPVMKIKKVLTNHDNKTASRKMLL